MTRFRESPLAGWAIGLVLGIGGWFVAGCGGPVNPAGGEVQASNLRAIATFYKQYENSHRRQPPENEAEFKAYLKTLPQEQLAARKVSDVDQALISERDHAPYVILYGKQAGSGNLIASERNGKDGKRMVAHRTGQVQLVDEAEFQKLAPAGAK